MPRCRCPGRVPVPLSTRDRGAAGGTRRTGRGPGRTGVPGERDPTRAPPARSAQGLEQPGEGSEGPDAALSSPRSWVPVPGDGSVAQRVHVTLMAHGAAATSMALGDPGVAPTSSILGTSSLLLELRCWAGPCLPRGSKVSCLLGATTLEKVGAGSCVLGQGPNAAGFGATSHSWRCWSIPGGWAPPRVRAPVLGPAGIKALARWRGDYVGVPRASFRQHHAATRGRVVFSADLVPPQNHLGLPQITWASPKSPGSLAVLGGMKMMLGAWGVPTPGGYTEGG